MNLTREGELRLFRNINGVNKTWGIDNSRVSYTDSNQIVHLRRNQGVAKAKFIKFINKDGGRDKVFEGVD